MKSKLSFKYKLKFIYDLLFKKECKGIVIICGNCGSTNLSIISNKKNNNINKSKYICNTCKALCNNQEKWSE